MKGAEKSLLSEKKLNRDYNVPRDRTSKPVGLQFLLTHFNVLTYES